MEININNTIKYEDDTHRNGATPYFSRRNWAFSSTGNFLDDSMDSDVYILSNVSNLHKIVFTQKNSFSSLGKRVFKVYVQGELKLKDFDIVKEAGGTGRSVIKSYTVYVKNNTLKIQLFWAGKGTTGIPSRGTYGPIISAEPST
ncbi:hypothetical protein L1987_32774 [Smallanthus sonchifolius]|uniref:Uncharacterized protein n=1 Tax=Smallanthus sonchifolius TaxID=185202 RepID=A0ACB9HQJ5_9ASTR|nr:hypothetical protein L1987_32774 [Smallanthus sonchifolius]